MVGMADNYKQYMSLARGTPGCLIVLLDQSAAMAEGLGDRFTKAACAASKADSVLEQVLDQCTKGDRLRDDIDVGVIGFGNGLTEDLLGQGGEPGGLLTVNELESRARIEEYVTDEDDGTGKLLVRKRSTWFSPRTAGSTLLAPAIDAAAAKVGTWVAAYRTSYPPIILIITGGHIADKAAAEKSAASLKRMGTSDGAVLVFVCHVSSLESLETEFPSGERSLSDEQAKWLAFSLASEMPKRMTRYGRSMGLPIHHRARGYVTPIGVFKFARLLSAAANNSEWSSPFFDDRWELGEGDANEQERRDGLDGGSIETASTDRTRTMTGTYRQEISASKNLFGCLIVLLDQSGSMADMFGADKRSKVVAATRAVNTALETLVDCGGVRDHYHAGVIGYGASGARDLLGVGNGPGGLLANSELDARAAVERIEFDEDDGTGKLKVAEFRKWFDPACAGGTPMDEAFVMAADKLREWVGRYPSSFPPMVLNITDGEANVPKAAEAAALALRKISTSDGETLLFNCHISASGTVPIEYPTSDTGLSEDLSKWLFRISSEIPETMVRNAQAAGLSAVTTGSRGFVYNATAGKLVKFLRFSGMLGAYE